MAGRHVNTVKPTPVQSKRQGYLPGLVSLAPRVLYLGAFVAVVAGILLSRQPYPQLQTAALGAAAVYTVVCMTIPSQRVRLDHVLTPSNWMAMGWFLQLVLIPAMVATLGPTFVQLMTQPKDAWMAQAVMLQVVAFLAYVVGRGAKLHLDETPTVAGPKGVWILVLIAIGVVSMIGFFGGVGPLIAYFTGEVTAAAGWGYLSFGASLLVAAGVLMVARAVNRGRHVLVSLGLALLLIVGGFGISGYSRGMVVCAVIALLGTLSLRWRRIPVTILACGGILALIAAVLLGSYRSTYLLTDGGSASVSVDSREGPSMRSIVEIYMRGPQYLGVIPGTDQFIEVTPRVIMNSTLAPLPVIGSSFRDDTSRQYYSPLVRGTSDYTDISPPFVGELYWAFGVLGLIAFIAVGRIVRFLDRRFYSAATFGGGYVWLFMGAWMGYLLIGSIQVMIQTAVVSGLAMAVIYMLARPASGGDGQRPAQHGT